jgi:predicted Zn-dependent protease
VSARNGDISTALALAEQVDRLAEASDDPRDPADAALNRAEITHLAGDRGQASELISQAIEHYQRKEATAYIARAQGMAAQWALAT